MISYENLRRIIQVLYFEATNGQVMSDEEADKLIEEWLKDQSDDL